MANDCIPLYEPGQDLTGQASANVTGKRCLKISGNRTADGNIAVAHADAAGRICGVAKYDAASGKKVGVLRGSGRVVPITLSANVAAFQEVEVTANGQVGPLAAGVAIGYAITAGVAAADGQICLY